MVLHRNLLFLGVCAGGLLSLAATVSPRYRPSQHPPPTSAETVSVRATVDRLNSVTTMLSTGDQVVTHAEPLALIRRLSLSLAGTIPSLEEIRQFEALPEEQAVGLWIARLLDDRRSSDYLAERFARALVGTEDGPFLIYRRRRFVAWLADQLHANRPYDEIVRQTIASDGLWTDKPATNFVTVTIKPDQDLGPDASLLATRVSRALLGVRLDCAECHDHPFKSWKQTDFQALAAFFGQTKHSLRGIRDEDGPCEIDDPASGTRLTVVPGVPFAASLLPATGTPRARLAAWITHPENRAFARATANRCWVILFGQPLVEPLDDLPPTGETLPELELLADDFVTHGYDLRRLLATIALSDRFQAGSRTAASGETVVIGARDDSKRDLFPLTRLRPEQIVGSVQQAATFATIDYESHVILRAARWLGQAEFISQYGDSGADEFAAQGGTIPQRLLLMNGRLVKERTKDNLITNSATQIAALAATDEQAVETGYLACLTRRPTSAEMEYFTAKLAGTRGAERREVMEDLFWTLVNSTEFSWNH